MGKQILNNFNFLWSPNLLKYLRYADAVTYDPVTKKDYFVLPHEEQMLFKDFLNHLNDKNDKNAYYISLQNGNLPMEYGPLINDVDPEINWCSQALDKSPDAVNFWFGDEKSITSLHKDPYENLYAVIRGQKTFILYPPIEYMCLHGNSLNNIYTYIYIIKN